MDTRDNGLHLCIDRLSQLDKLRLHNRYLHRNDDKSHARLHAWHIALQTAKKWPNGRVLRCRFLDGPTSVQQRVINQARKWMEHANITFDFVQSGDAEVRISFIADSGSWSYLGNDALVIPHDEPTMNFGWLDEGTDEAEYERVVLHEFGHALGCIHEHSSPAGGMKWDRPKVIAAFSGPPNNWSPQDIEEQIFFRYAASQTVFTQIDPKSIMMYDFPASLMTDHVAIPGGKTLTTTDIEFIRGQYPKAPPAMPQIAVGGAAVSASIAKPGERDTFQFAIPSDATYRVETRGTTDVYLTVTGPNDFSRLVAEDDDSGIGTNARITTRMKPGIYQATVHHWDPKGTGNYSILVKKS